MKEIVSKLLDGEVLTDPEAGELVAYLTNPDLDPVLAATALAALRTRGETASEVRVFASALQDLAIQPEIEDVSNAVDVDRVNRGLARSDEVRSCEVDAIVDTGSTRSVIPAEIAERLGLTLVDHAIGKLADGSAINVGICGGVRFEIMGRRTIEEAYIMGSDTLIGQTTLEGTDLLVDCKEQRLIGKHAEGPIFRL